MKSFGEKSYFYRKSCGLPPAEPDDDPGPGTGECGEMRGHDFEEPEAVPSEADLRLVSLHKQLQGH